MVKSKLGFRFVRKISNVQTFFHGWKWPPCVSVKSPSVVLGEWETCPKKQMRWFSRGSVLMGRCLREAVVTWLVSVAIVLKMFLTNIFFLSSRNTLQPCGFQWEMSPNQNGQLVSFKNLQSFNLLIEAPSGPNQNMMDSSWLPFLSCLSQLWCPRVLNSLMTPAIKWSALQQITGRFVVTCGDQSIGTTAL